MKKTAALLLVLAALPLAACGGSTETTNSAVTENGAADPFGNDLPAEEAVGNIGEGNEIALNDTLLDNAAAPLGNELSVTDNSR